MNRRTFLATAASVLAQPLAAAPAKTNILLILADDLGQECLSCYGSESYRTPNLDRMAAHGIRFTHAYAQPLCTPTRVQLMTGKLNQRNWRAFGVMDPKETTFGHRMRALGYRTAIAGKWQLYSYNPPDFEPEWRGKGMLPEQGGFDEYCLWHAFHTEEKGSRYGDPTVLVNGKLERNLKDRYGDDLFSDFLSRFMENNKDRPFFAYYPMALTHAPFNPTPRSKDWNTPRRLKNDRVYFKDMVEYMDEVVGRLLARVDSLGLAQRTFVLFFADNGTDQSIVSQQNGREVKGGKGLTTDAGIHVPLIASWKGTMPEGKVLDDLIDSTDFLPTMYDAAGARPPSDAVLDGRSFFPQLKGERGSPRDWIYAWYDPRPGHDKEKFTRTRYAFDHRYKLYADGRLFEWPRDLDERNPLPRDAYAGPYRKLEAVLKRYEVLRTA
jgi:arylsulfatase A